MDYSRYNTELTRHRIRSAGAKAEKKIAFNILRFVVIAMIIAMARFIIFICFASFDLGRGPCRSPVDGYRITPHA